MLLYGTEFWTLTEEHVIRMETAETHFLRAVAGQRMTEHKRNGYITEELGTTERWKNTVLVRLILL